MNQKGYEAVKVEAIAAAESPGPKRPPGILAAVSLMLFTVFGTVSGFFRELFVAYIYGTSWQADIFAVLIYYYDSINIIILSGIAGLSVVPYLSLRRQEGNEQDGIRTVMSFGSMLAIFSVIVSIAILIYSLELTHVLFPGLTDAQAKDAATFIGLAFLGIGPLVAANFIFTVLQAHFSFNAIPQGRILFNAVIIVSLIAAYFSGQPLLVASGFVIAVVVQLLLALLISHKQKLFELFSLKTSPEIGRLVQIMLVPLVIVVLTNFIYGTIELLVLSRLGIGNVSGVRYANRVITLFNSINVSLQVVFFARAGREESAGAEHKTAELFSRIVSRAFFILIPLSFLTAVISKPLVRILFQHGSFGAESSLTTASALQFYTFSLVGGFLWGMCMRYGLLLDRRWISLFIVIVFFFSGMVSLFLFMPWLSQNAIPAGFVVANWSASLTGLLLLKISLGAGIRIREILFSGGSSILLSVVSASAALYAMNYLSAYFGEDDFGSIFLIISVSLVFMAIYLFISYITGNHNLRSLRNEVFSNLKRKQPTKM